MKARSIPVAAILLAILGTGLAADAQQRQRLNPREIQRLTAEGDKLLAEGNPLEARRRFATVLEADPANAPVALKLARIAEDVGDWNGAIAAYQVVAQHGGEEDRAGAYAGMASAHSRLSQHEQAVENARQAIALDASNAEVQIVLGLGLLETGSSTEALAAARRAIELAPQSGPAHALLGQALLAEGMETEADDVLRKAAELSPDAAEVHAGLAEIEYGRGNLEAAIALASKALDLDPQLTHLYGLRGRAYHAAGQGPAAYVDLSAAVKAVPGDVDLLLAFAEVQRLQGLPVMAVASYREALALKPDIGTAHLALGELLIEQGERTAAREALDAAARLLPDSALVFRHLGALHAADGNPDEAIEAYGAALERDQTLAGVHHARARLLRDHRKDAAGALAGFERAEELEPDNPEFLTDLGAALYDAGQGERSLALLEKAVGTAGYDNPLGFGVLGLALKDHERFAEALGWFERAAAGSPEWWLPHWGASWSHFGLIRKGCPCDAADDERVERMKQHFDRMVALGGQDAALQQRVEALVKGQKVR